VRSGSDDPKVEALARDLLRETLQRQRWYPRRWQEDRDRLIERDVELLWRMMAKAARERLEESSTI
jgi:hypothetical protein